MPKKPTLLGTPSETQVREMRAAGKSVDTISSFLGLPRRQVQTLVAIIDSDAPGQGWIRPAYPDVGGKTSKESIQLHAKWLSDALGAAAKGGAPPKELSSLAGQYTAALKLVAQIDGSLDITGPMILRSSHIRPIMGAIRRVFETRPELWSALQEELDKLSGEHG